MNKKSISTIVGLFFSILFYNQDYGLNHFLFSTIIVGLLYTLYPIKFQQTRVINYAVIHLLISSMVFFFPSRIASIASIVSFFVLLGTITEVSSSILVLLCNGFYSTIASRTMSSYQRIRSASTNNQEKPDYIYWTKLIGIPLMVVLIFTYLYRQANPYFDDIIQNIDITKIDISLVMFTSFGFFLVYNIISPTMIEPMTQIDLNTDNILVHRKVPMQDPNKLKQENQLGITMLIILITLLSLYLTTDVLYLINTSLGEAAALSKSVHQGIYALITSIVLAITIIIYFFRGSLNFFKDNHTLKQLTYVWLALNILLIIITGYKNYLYVHDYGLTYKRIGVFVYLILSFVGIMTTYFKVFYTFNFWYVLRKNTQIAYIILLILSIVNWDSNITYYNTHIATNIDYNYLVDLSHNNTTQLYDFMMEHQDNINLEQQRDIQNKHTIFIEDLAKNSWQELVFNNFKTKQ